MKNRAKIGGKPGNPAYRTRSDFRANVRFRIQKSKVKLKIKKFEN